MGCDALSSLRRRMRTARRNRRRPRGRSEGRPRFAGEQRSRMRKRILLGAGAVRPRSNPSRDDPTRQFSRRRPPQRCARPCRAPHARNDSATWKGQCRAVRVCSVVDSRRLRRRKAVQGRTWLEQHRDEHTASCCGRNWRAREQLRRRWRDRMLRRHRSRGRIRFMGHESRRVGSCSFLENAGAKTQGSGGPHHRSDEAYDSDELCGRHIAASLPSFHACSRERDLSRDHRAQMVRSRVHRSSCCFQARED